MEKLKHHKPDSGFCQVPAPHGAEHHLRSTWQLRPRVSHLSLFTGSPQETAPKTKEVFLAVPWGSGGFLLISESGREWDTSCFQLTTSSISEDIKGQISPCTRTIKSTGQAASPADGPRAVQQRYSGGDHTAQTSSLNCFQLYLMAKCNAATQSPASSACSSCPALPHVSQLS